MVGTFFLLNSDNGLTLKHKNLMILLVFKCQNSSQHSQEVWREPDWAVHHDQVVDECNRKQSSDTGYWSDEMKEDFVNAPHWSIEKWISVLAKGGGRTKKRVSILLEFELSSEVLVFSSNPRTFRQYHLSRRKQKRIEVNSESWLESRRSQSQNRQTSCVLHCCESDG